MKLLMANMLLCISTDFICLYISKQKHKIQILFHSSEGMAHGIMRPAGDGQLHLDEEDKRDVFQFAQNSMTTLVDNNN